MSEDHDFREEVLQRLTRIEQAVSEVKDLDERVGKLEGWRSWVTGAVAIIMTLGAYIHIPKLKL